MTFDPNKPFEVVDTAKTGFDPSAPFESVTPDHQDTSILDKVNALSQEARAKLDSVTQHPLDALANAGEGVQDFVTQSAHSVPGISSLVEGGVANLREALTGFPAEDSIAQMITDEELRRQRSPIATKLGDIEGLGAGIVASLPLSAPTQAVLGLGQSAVDQMSHNGQLNPTELGIEGGIGLASVALPAGLRAGASKAEEVGSYLKSKFGEGSDALIKKLLGRSGEEIQKDLTTAVRGNDSVTYDEIAKKVRESGAFDNFLKDNKLPLTMEDRANVLASANNETGQAVGSARAGRPDVNLEDTSKYLENQANSLNASTAELNPEKLSDLQTVRNNLMEKGRAASIGNLGPTPPLVSPDLISNSKSTYQDIFRKSGEKNISSGNKADIFSDLERQSMYDPALSPEDNLQKLKTFDAASREHVLTSKGLEKLSELSAKGQGKNMGTWSQIIRNNASTLGAVGLNKLSTVDLPAESARALAGAIEKGGNAAILTTHYLLMQKDPEYRKAVSEADTQQAQQAAPGQAVYSTEK